MQMNLPLFKKLVEAHGVSGFEDQVRDIVREEMKGMGDLRTDWMGNLICHRKGKGKKKLMIAAHMDEIGFLVKHIDDKGFIRPQAIGGWDARQMASQRVLVHTKKGPLPGILTLSSKPKHLLTPEEANKGPQFDNYFIDLGMSAEDVKKKVQIGDMVTMNRGLQHTGDLLTCKAMDDRVAVYVMIEAMRMAKSNEVDVYGVATVQEEIGLRGAAAAGSAIAPDLVVAIDITLANDIPGIPEQDHITKLGEGAAIKIMDSSLICHPKMVSHFKSLAEKNKIKHQIEVLPLGGTDAGGVQRLHGGIPAFTLSVPTRYVHTVNETVHGDDVDNAVKLLAKYIEDAHNGDYSY
ncbi:MAG: M42 family metallopeptidase [Armatimonadetes bacterium]|nr:M42 family metallopeptidase [Armatimonadota bacterium]